MSVRFGPKFAFKQAEFGSETLFIKVEFGEKVEFLQTKFGNAIQFLRVTFGSGALICDTEFQGDVIFDNSTFLGDAAFAFSAQEATVLGETFNGDVSFDGFLKSIQVKKKALFSGVNLSRASFGRARLDTLHFETCTWNESMTESRIVIRDEAVIIKNISDKGIKQVEYKYRAFKQKYKEMHDEGTAGLFHASEKRMLTLRTHFMDKPFDWAILNLYKLSSGYGENPGRAFVTLLWLILLVFTLVGSVGLIPRGTTDSPNTTKIYMSKYGPFEVPSDHTTSKQDFSAVVDTTADYLLIAFHKTTYHDLKPASGRGWVLLSVSILFVYIQTLLFVFALRNRLRR